MLSNSLLINWNEIPLYKEGDTQVNYGLAYEVYCNVWVSMYNWAQIRNYCGVTIHNPSLTGCVVFNWLNGNTHRGYVLALGC